jgi:hypothetical protein
MDFSSLPESTNPERVSPKSDAEFVKSGKPESLLFNIPDYSRILAPKLSAADDLVEEQRNLAHRQSAGYLRDIIVKRIKTVQDSLDSEHEVALLLASFGTTVHLIIESIQAVGPSCLIFSGYVGDRKVTLIQNVSQLSVLIDVTKLESKRPAHRMGF